MLKVKKILVTALVLAGSAAVLSGCGQKGPLRAPDSPAALNRATLPQSLNPWHAPSSASTQRRATDTTSAPAAVPDTLFLTSPSASDAATR